MTYHVARNGEVVGTFNAREFRARIAAGEIARDDYFWTEEMTEWQTVSEWRPQVAPTIKLTPIPLAEAPTAKQSKKPVRVAKKGERICLACGYVGRPRPLIKTLSIDEFAVWLVCILLALFVSVWTLLIAVAYSVWRTIRRGKVCPACRIPGMVASDLADERAPSA